jgi:hypothetical protein
MGSRLKPKTTSYTDVADYLPYRVPEVWLWKKQVLKIYRLQNGEYALQDKSIFLPSIDLPVILQTVIEDAYARNSSFAIRSLRKRLLEY